MQAFAHLGAPLVVLRSPCGRAPTASENVTAAFQTSSSFVRHAGNASAWTHSSARRACRLRAPATTPAQPSQVSMCARGEGIYASPSPDPSSIRVVVFGATGYIGRFVVREFAQQGYDVVAFTRNKSGVKGKDTPEAVQAALGENVRIVVGDVMKPKSIAKAFTDTDSANHSSQGADAVPKTTIVVSCLASRTGGISDSNRIDYQATLNTLNVGRQYGAKHFILLSAICVQNPLLAFQRAKLRFEDELYRASDQDPSFSYSIVRPTAFFKSLAGQIERVQKGDSFIMFGEGDMCKCNPLSEADLARFMALCAVDLKKRNSILPVGGPGEAVTPKEQAEMVFKILDQEPVYTKLPIGLMDVAIGALDAVGFLIPPVKELAEFGRIGKYYATEDMVGPRFGTDTLEDFFKTACKDGGLAGQELGDAAIF